MQIAIGGPILRVRFFMFISLRKPSESLNPSCAKVFPLAAKQQPPR
jgi:hypothetical protein